jgi:hypothetical protein
MTTAVVCMGREPNRWSDLAAVGAFSWTREADFSVLGFNFGKWESGAKSAAVYMLSGINVCA